MNQVITYNWGHYHGQLNRPRRHCPQNLIVVVFFPWEIGLTLALLIHNLRFDLQKMGRTIRFDDGQTRSPIPFHWYSPFSLTISKQFWVFVFLSPAKAVQMVAVMAIY